MRRKPLVEGNRDSTAKAVQEADSVINAVQLILNKIKRHEQIDQHIIHNNQPINEIYEEEKIPCELNFTYMKGHKTSKLDHRYQQ